MGNGVSTHNTNSDVVKIERLRSSAYLELNIERQLTGELRAFNAKTVPIDSCALSGLYAYGLVTTDTQGQYLLLNPLKDYDSNHGLFELFLKKLPGYSPEKMHIIAGGEVVFSNREIISWNLKSACYSKGGRFDQANNHLSANLELLWLPLEKYQPMDIAENYAKFFSRRGSFLTTEPTDISTPRSLLGSWP